VQQSLSELHEEALPIQPPQPSSVASARSGKKSKLTKAALIKTLQLNFFIMLHPEINQPVSRSF
jgi:hypothetical protein